MDARLLVDGIGMLYSVRKPWKKLAQRGVRVALFMPPRLFRPISASTCATTAKCWCATQWPLPAA